jgi:putative glutamine amidotransferase
LLSLLAYNRRVRVLVSRSDTRPFEVDRFSAAWKRAGGDPAELAFVSPSTAAETVRPEAGFDGLLLTGGPDVDPARFGTEPQPGVVLRTDPARDALDLGLLARAEAERWPVLAICYGCQLLAVSAGGTVVQDLERAGTPGHKVAEPKDHPAHVVTVSAAARFLPPGGGTIVVNSRHHQAVGEPGQGMVVVACAPDGVVEAIEPAAGDRFVLGVQWHPENMTQPEHMAIFGAFRAACLRRSFSPGAP